MECCKSDEKVHEEVSEYYGKRLEGSRDLKTNACKCGCGCSIDPAIKEALSEIDDEIVERSYGCGSPIPPLLEGLTVLDLGCGTGKDVYVLSKLVGEKGHVIGVDMTPEQLEVAERHRDSQARRFGYPQSNVEFRRGYIEDLEAVGIADGSVDLVVSNCVINLSPRKDLVFKEIRRVLKQGGELYFSDVFADRRVPQEVYDNPVLHGECLGGAMYTEDFRRLMERTGFMDFRVTAESPIELDGEIADAVGDARFVSRTIRAFKLGDLEDRCEDYGQTAIYKGSIPGHEDDFAFDDEHRFYTNEAKRVCGNTAAMLSETRYSKAFTVTGDRKVHRGRFDCSGEKEGSAKGCCCCC